MKKKDAQTLATKLTTIAIAIGLIGAANASTVVKKPDAENEWYNASIITGNNGVKLISTARGIRNQSDGKMGMYKYRTDSNIIQTNYRQEYNYNNNPVFFNKNGLGESEWRNTNVNGYFKDAKGDWLWGNMGQYYFIANDDAMYKSLWAKVDVKYYPVLDDTKDIIADRFLITNSGVMYRIDRSGTTFDLVRMPYENIVSYSTVYSKANSCFELNVGTSDGKIVAYNFNDTDPLYVFNTTPDIASAAAKGIVKKIDGAILYIDNGKLKTLKKDESVVSEARKVAIHRREEFNYQTNYPTHDINHLVYADSNFVIPSLYSNFPKPIPISEFAHHNMDKLFSISSYMGNADRKIDLYFSGLANGEVAYTFVSREGLISKGIIKTNAPDGAYPVTAQLYEDMHIIYKVGGVESRQDGLVRLAFNWSDSKISASFFKLEKNLTYSPFYIEDKLVQTVRRDLKYAIAQVRNSGGLIQPRVAGNKLLLVHGSVDVCGIQFDMADVGYSLVDFPRACWHEDHPGIDYVEPTQANWLRVKNSEDRFDMANIGAVALPTTFANIDQQGLPNGSFMVTPSSTEVAHAPGKIVGLNDDGMPYFIGYNSEISNFYLQWNIGSQHHTPVVISLEDTGNVSNVTATKGAFSDKVVVTWNGGSGKYKVQPQICNPTCVDTGSPIDVSGQRFEHTLDAGVPADANRGSSKRVAYKVAPVVKAQVYPNKTSTELASSVGGYVSSNQGYLGAPPTSTVAVATVDSNTSLADLTLTTVDPDEGNQFTYTVLTQPANGVAVVGADGKLKYSVGNFSGTDSFTYRVTDDSGGSVEGTATVTVNCPLPEIVSFGAPTSVKAYQDNLYTFKYRANMCNGQTLNYKFTASDTTSEALAAHTKTGTLTTQTTDTTGVVTFADPNPGIFNLTLEVASSTDPTKKATKVANAEVKGISNPTIKVTPDITKITEDDLITLSLGFENKDCEIYGSQQEAEDFHGCYVKWTHAMTGTNETVTLDKSTLTGYGEHGNMEVKAEVFKTNSQGVIQLVDTVIENVYVQPGTPVTFDKPKIAGPVRQYLDLVSHNFSQKTGNNCTSTTSLTVAAAAAAQGKQVCFFAFELPEGVLAAADGSPSFAGRVKGATSGQIKYTVSKYFASKPMEEIDTGTIALEVTPITLEGSVLTDHPQYAKGVQNAIVTAKVDENLCPMTSDENAAKSSYNRSSLTCLGQWNNLPTWLTPSTTKMQATGTVPATKGAYPISYDLFMVDGAGTKTLLGSYSGNVDVVDLPAIAVAITPVGGSLTDGEGKPVYAIDGKGMIGSMKITGSSVATVRAGVSMGTQLPVVSTKIQSGSSIDLAVNAQAGSAWVVRDLNIALEYEGLADKTQNRTEVIKVAQLPVSGMSAVIEKPASAVVSTAPFSLKGKVGVAAGTAALTYSAQSHGQWTAFLAEQTETGFSPLTDEVAVSTTGSAVFENLDYQDIFSRKVVMVAKPKLPDGMTFTGDLKLVSPIAKIDFLSGEPLPATVIADKLKAFAPHTGRFDVMVPSDSAESLGMVTWQMSVDGGTTWKEMEGLIGKSGSYKFSSGGMYLVRANVVNKYSKAAAYTAPVELDIKQTLKMALTGHEMQLPGRPVTLNLKATDLTGGEVNYDSRWIVQSSAGTEDVHNDLNELTLESAYQATYNVTVQTKPKTMSADDPEAWTTVTKTVKFGYPEPVKANVSGPKRIEVGVPGKFVASVKFTDTDSLKLKGQWVLPAGVTTTDSLEGKEVNLTFAADTFNEGDAPAVTYKTWIEGAQTQTEWASTYAPLITEYQFAKFMLNKTAETLAAPAYLRVQVEPENRDERKKIGSQKITYTWTAPEGAGLTVKTSGSSLVVIAEQAGEYPISVVVSDQLGNDQKLDYVLKVVAADPYVAKLALVEGLKFNRAPMTYLVKPTVTGGHPDDKITKYELLVNDVVVATGTGNRPPKQLVIENAGTHSVKLKGASEMGMAFESTAVSTIVKPNVAPVCLDLAVGWDRKRTSASVTAKCTDGDGRVKAYRWYVNEALQEKRTGSRMSLDADAIGSSATVRLEVIDDSGDVTTKNATLTP